MKFAAAILFSLLAPNLAMVDQLNAARTALGNSPYTVNQDLNTMAKLAAQNPKLFSRAFEPMLRLRKLPTWAYVTIRTKVTPTTDIETLASGALSLPVMRIITAIKAPCLIGTHLADEILYTVITCDDPRKHRRI